MDGNYFLFYINVKGKKCCIDVVNFCFCYFNIKIKGCFINYVVGNLNLKLIRLVVNGEEYVFLVV